MRAGKPVLRGLRKAVSRLLIVDAFEDKIVAEHEPIARGVRRARESTGNRGDCDVNCDFRGRSDFHFDFQPWLSSWTADLAVRTISCGLRVASDDNPPLFGAALSLPATTAQPKISNTGSQSGTGPVPGQHRTNGGRPRHLSLSTGHRT
jgi:hypothetical protein